MKFSLSRHQPISRAATLCSTVCLAAALCVLDRVDALAGQLAIRQQGGRPFGGKVVGDPGRGSLHWNHGYVESARRIPQNARALPMVMVSTDSSKTWDTTFDGREGFRNIFLRRGFPVYLTDLPRTGRAGQGCASTTYTPRADNDQASFTTWRLGLWLPDDPTPDFYPGVQFPANVPAALNEFSGSSTPSSTRRRTKKESKPTRSAVLLGEIGPFNRADALVYRNSRLAYRDQERERCRSLRVVQPGAVVFPEGEVSAADREGGWDAGARRHCDSIVGVHAADEGADPDGAGASTSRPS